METVHALHAAAGRFATPRRCHDFVAQFELVYQKPLSPDATAEGQKAWLAGLRCTKYTDKPPAFVGVLGPAARLQTTLLLQKEPTPEAVAHFEDVLNADYARKVFAEVDRPFPEGAIRLAAQLRDEPLCCAWVTQLYDIALASAEAAHLAMTADVPAETVEAVLGALVDPKAATPADLAAIAEFCQHPADSDASPLDTLAEYTAEARATMDVAEQMES